MGHKLRHESHAQGASYTLGAEARAGSVTTFGIAQEVQTPPELICIIDTEPSSDVMYSRFQKIQISRLQLLAMLESPTGYLLYISFDSRLSEPDRSPSRAIPRAQLPSA
jgi:hypothetical protein